jgi:hypothetical protein
MKYKERWITSQRAALAAMRRHGGYLNEWRHPADGLFAVGPRASSPVPTRRKRLSARQSRSR